MGTYYECEICGKVEKGLWPCDCHEKQNRVDLAELTEGCKILESHFINECHASCLYQKLKDEKGDVFFIRYVFPDGHHPSSVGEIYEAEYEEIRPHENEESLEDQKTDREVKNQLDRELDDYAAERDMMHAERMIA